MVLFIVVVAMELFDSWRQLEIDVLQILIVIVSLKWVLEVA